MEATHLPRLSSENGGYLNLPPSDIIAAPATPPGRGGVAVVRVSGLGLATLAADLAGQTLRPRHAHYAAFHDSDGSVIDQGLALYFPAPSSYTGEDVLELHCHGNPLLVDRLLRRLLQLGARLAQPGEFTQRAYLNGKMDLAQAEAVADLISASTDLALRSARHALEGEFSRRVDDLAERLLHLRVHAEANLDFSDEDISPQELQAIERGITAALNDLAALLGQTRQGVILQEGYTVVLAGRPNSGKSSLLNRLVGREAAIVTHIPGTTRDILREAIQIDGLPLHVVDTAGLRETEDLVEQEGVRRARQTIAQGDRVLHVIDATDPSSSQLDEPLPCGLPVTRVYNKIDLAGLAPGIAQEADATAIRLSAKTGEGLDLLRQHLKQAAGFQAEGGGLFIARRRHLEALQRCQSHLQACTALPCGTGQELLAENLRLAHDALAEITGALTPDDLLGAIFSEFCIGK